MRVPSRAVFVATASLMAFLVGESPTAACSCLPRPTLDGAFASAAAVFEAVVVEHKGVEVGPRGLHRFVLEVSRSWKGVSSSRVEVLTPDFTACGVVLQVGEDYRLFGYDDAPYVLNRCRQPRFDRSELTSLGEPIWVNRDPSWTTLNEEILTAVWEGASERLRHLIAAGNDVNGRDLRHGTTPLVEAALQGNVAILEILLEAGADVDVVRKGRTAIQVAVSRGHVEVVKRLLERDATAKPEWAIDAGEPAVLRLILGTGRMVTPFLWHRAAQRGDPVLLELLWEHRASPEGGFDDWALTASLDANDTRALEWLLNKKADPNVRTPNGEAPLVVATLKGKSDHVMRLLDAGADPNFGYAHGYTALMAAISSSEDELVELYLARGAAITASRDDGTTALHIAAGRGKQELMERLVEAGAKLDAMAEDGTPLMTACSSGHADDVRWLLDAGADPKLVSPEGLTTLDEAASSGNAATVHLLLNAGAKADDGAPIAHAARRRHWSLLPPLLEARARVDATAFGRTALTIAAAAGHERSVELLIGARAALSDGATLAGAAANGHWEIVGRLLDAGAEVNLADSSQASALTAAAVSAQIEVVRRLLERGADPNHGDQTYSNPVLAAVGEGHTAVLRVLAERGANLSRHFSTNALQNFTALHGSVVSGSPETVRFLLEQGLDADEPVIFEEVPLTALSLLPWFLIEGPHIRDDELAVLLDVSRALLEAGADPTLEVEPGLSAIHLAEKTKLEPLIELLSQPWIVKSHPEP